TLPCREGYNFTENLRTRVMLKLSRLRQADDSRRWAKQTGALHQALSTASSYTINPDQNCERHRVDRYRLRLSLAKAFRCVNQKNYILQNFFYLVARYVWSVWAAV